MQIIKKYCPFLLKIDHFHFAAIFQPQKVEKIKNRLIYVISNHECTTILVHNKCVEVTHWLKKCLYFVGILDFSLGGGGGSPDGDGGGECDLNHSVLLQKDPWKKQTCSLCKIECSNYWKIMLFNF